MTIELKLPVNFQEKDLRCQILKSLPKKWKKELQLHPGWTYRFLRLSLDAREKSNLHYLLRLEILREGEEEREEDIPFLRANTPSCAERRPIVVGAGPAGLFAAYALAEAGHCPLLLEQGEEVSIRQEDVERFWSGGPLNEHSNVQYGEGGAGTFSDGKLHTGIKSPWVSYVFRRLVEHGAPQEILWSSQPHIGTDRLPAILESMRQQIVAWGGTYRFGYRYLHVRKVGSALSLQVEKVSTGQLEEIPAAALFLASGHSHRPTYLHLAEDGIRLESKASAVGFRIEHPQSLINASQYGKENVTKYGKILPPSPYKLVGKGPTGRPVYSFCMCPGGEVIASASEKEQVVTNGMSRYQRAAYHANSALLVAVGPGDYLQALQRAEPPASARLRQLYHLARNQPELAGLFYQESLEYKAYLAAGQSQLAPTQAVGDFLSTLREKTSWNAEDCMMREASYRPGVINYDIRTLLQEDVITTIQHGIMQFEKKIKNFSHPLARLYAVESRSSSTVRILREASSRQASLPGLYPIGEGAGYAGGITSSAVDALKSVASYLGVSYEGK